MRYNKNDLKNLNTHKCIAIQLSHTELRSMCGNVDNNAWEYYKNDSCFMTRNGAKLYPVGGGWYRFLSYHYSGQDVKNDIFMLKNPNSVFIDPHALAFALRRKLGVVASKYPSSPSFIQASELGR
jgi:hypothetical protein